MGAIADLWKSERGLLAVLIIVAASVLAGLDKMAVADWQTFVMGIFIAYAAGKTVTGAVAIMKGTTDPAPEPAARPATPAELDALNKRIDADNAGAKP
jgi:hypothetical protein